MKWKAGTVARVRMPQAQDARQASFAIPVEASREPLRFRLRRLLCAVLVMTLIVNAIPFMSTAEEDVIPLDVESERVDAIVRESGEIDLGGLVQAGSEQSLPDPGFTVEFTPDGAEGEGVPAATEDRRFALGGGAVCLREILEAVGLSVELSEIESVGLSDEAMTGLLCVEAAEDGDYILSARQDFDAVELCVDTGDEVFAILLTDGEGPEAEEPTVEETEEPVVEETEEPAVEETEEPVVEETEEPAVEETEEPVVEETEEPAAEETEEPVVEETEEPVVEETEEPVVEQTEEPAAEETEEPVVEQTEEPTAEETEEPSVELIQEAPSEEPTVEETEEPTAEETEEPVVEETEEPVAEETEEPSDELIVEETEEPTEEPTVEPTGEPTEEPTGEPTGEPTPAPADTPAPESTPAVYTAMIDLSDVADYPLSLKGVMSSMLEAEGAEGEAPEIAPGDVVCDPALIQLAYADGDCLVTPVAAFDLTVLTVGSAFIITFANYAPPRFPAQAFEARVAGVSVSVEAPEGAFPEGTTMSARPVWDSDTLSDIENAVAEDFVEVKRVHAVDITFYCDGAEVEPLLPINVVMTLSTIEEQQEAVVVHVDDEGAAEVVEQAADAGTGTESVAFEADAFSIYAVVVTETIETLYIDANGDTYDISVGFGADSGLSASAELSVSEVTGDEQYLRETEELLPDNQRIVAARYFDIRIIQDGVEVQPLTPVEVRVTMERSEGDVSAVHFGANGPEIVEASVEDEAVRFDAASFSVYGVFYSVDFEYNDLKWCIQGGTDIWLSSLLEWLETDKMDPAFGIADVKGVEFSDSALLTVTRDETKRDWNLTSMPASNVQGRRETLTLTLNDGSTRVIAVTFDDEQPIAGFLSAVEFLDGDVHVGGSNDPNPMMVRPGHVYNMHLTFTENEHDSATGQFTETGTMRYLIPNEVTLPLVDKAVSYFDVYLDRKNTLVNNEVTYHAAANGNKAYIDVKWNTEDRKKLKMLNASPRAMFTLNFEASIPEVDPPNEIRFSDDVVVDIIMDPNFTVDLEKSAVLGNSEDKSIIYYTVTAKADGAAHDVDISDLMGEALTYQEDPGVAVQYGRFVTVHDEQNDVDKEVFEAYDPQAAGYPYSGENACTGISHTDTGYSLTLPKLNDGDVAWITYSARVDYTKLGGKENIARTSRNTATATDKNGVVLDEASTSLEASLIYLQMAKNVSAITYNPVDTRTDAEIEAEEGYRNQNWQDQYVKWTVVYNPDQLIDVEGAELQDHIWAGARNAVTYVTDDPDKPFTVTVYREKGTYDYETGAFTPPSAGLDPGTVIKDDWEGVEVRDYAAGPSYNLDQLSGWNWTIPDKEANGLEEDEHYTYLISYWTKTDRSKVISGYIGNKAEESIAGITRDRPVNFPGRTSSEIQVEKEHIKDDYDSETGRVYSQWSISFERRTFSLDRALVEDTLPNMNLDDKRVFDTFVNDAAHPMVVTGLQGSEQCIPYASAESYDVVFRFYKYYVAEGHIDNRDGLLAGTAVNPPAEGGTGGDGGEDETTNPNLITITFWTLNDEDWIEASAQGRADSEHWNKAHLVLNGQEATDETYAIPKKTPTIDKVVDPEPVGMWTDADGMSLPVYKYTLKLKGVYDDAFIDGRLVIDDTFELPLKYYTVEELNELIDRKQLVLNDPKDGEQQPAQGASQEARHLDEIALVRTVPEMAADAQPWSATVTETETGIHITVDKADDMKYALTRKDEDGKVIAVLDREGKQAYAYGQVYTLTYYLALDHARIKEMAQEMVDEDGTETGREFYNSAKWDIEIDGIDDPTDGETVTRDLKPISKRVEYDSESELAKYTIVINPMKLRMNSGERFKVEDVYKNLAVDFETVEIACDPEKVDGKTQTVEWSYHSNKGTYWIPDNTNVTITYEGWPVGERGTKVSMENTAEVLGYTAGVSKEATLRAYHEGTAASYRVRIFKFGNDNMDLPLHGAVFQLFENNDQGEMVPMTYGVNASNPGEDDPEWTEVNALREAAGETAFPTPENHLEGQNIYFVTSNRAEGYTAGFAEVMLSQSRDGVALMKNHQYYLREVFVPNGYLRENIDWRFIIGDNDDWDSYVYSDNSVMQVSNASEKRDFAIRKVYDDRTSGGMLDYSAHAANDQFVIRSSDGKYVKTFTYSDFKRVDNPQPDGTTRTEYMMIIKDLDPGTYTVKEITRTALVDEDTDGAAYPTELTTLVNAQQTTTPKLEGVEDKPDLEHITTVTLAQTYYSAASEDDPDDVGFTFTLEDAGVYESSVDAVFTNIYTDANAAMTRRTVTKAFDNDGYTGKKAVFELYADGERFKLTNGEGGDADGNLVLPRIDSEGEEVWTATVDTLPMYKIVNGVQTQIPIEWTVKEVSATYRAAGRAEDTVASGIYLEEHFTVAADTAKDAATGLYPFTDEGTIEFTNTLNDLTTVKVEKTWSTGTMPTDSISFDLYRTTVKADAEAGATTGLTPVIAGYELNAGNDWTYRNDLMENRDNVTGQQWYYFAVEHSVAGYSAAYEIDNDDPGDEQNIAITNTADEETGTLAITKAVTGGPANLDKTYQFTVENSGRYLSNVLDGSWASAADGSDRVITVASGATTTINNVPVGEYTITELAGAAEIGGYRLTSVRVGDVEIGGALDTVEVGEETVQTIAHDCQTTITVSESTVETPVTTTVNVTNTYEQGTIPKTSFTFGKLWVIPDEEETNTLIWPENTSIQMSVYSRVKGSTEAGTLVGTYTLSKGGSGSAASETGGTGEPAGTTEPTNTEEPTVTAEPTVTPAPTPAAPTNVITVTAGSEAMPELKQVHNDFIDNYNHYTFILEENLDRFDADGNELEYYAIEVPDSLETAEGKTFEIEYGHVDGIGARVIENQDKAMASDNYVDCAINRLHIDAAVHIPVQKVLDGRFDLSGYDPSDYPPFTFILCDDQGREIKDDSDNTITATSDERGKATFTISDLSDIVNLNADMKWWSDELKLNGKYTFWIKEQANPTGDPRYNGITNISGAAKVDVNVSYDWVTGVVTTTMTMTNPGHKPGEVATEAVITNTYDPGTTTLKVKKTWDDANN